MRAVTVDLHYGDCLAVMRGLADASVDAVVTDPPYSSGGQFRGDRMQSTTSKYVQSGTQLVRTDFTGDNRDQRSFAMWATLWAAECRRVTKPGGVFIVFSDWRQLPTMSDVVQAGGWIWRGIAVWDKTEAARPQKGRYTNQAEYIIWGSNGPMPAPVDAPCLPGVFRYVVKHREKFHEAGKPVPLMRDLLRLVRPGGVILDPFMGSGSTGVAATQLGFDFIGIELQREIYDIAEQRISVARQQQTLSAEEVTQ